MPRNLSIRGVPDAVLTLLRERAAAQRRSMNSEVIAILEAAVAKAPGALLRASSPAAVREQGAAYAPATPLDTVDRALLADLCRRHSIRWLAVFGSFARGEAGPESDVDVVAEFEPGRTPGWGIVRVAEALRPAFGGRRVDLVTTRELGRLRAAVMESARTLHGTR